MDEPFPSAEAISASCKRLIEAGRELRQIPTSVICRELGELCRKWLEADWPGRRQAIEGLTAETGFPAKTIELCLDNLFGELSASALEAVVSSEIGDPEAVGVEVRGPKLAFHVLAGNIPGVGIFGVVAALLLRASSLVKASSRELLLPTLFARSLLTARCGSAGILSSAVEVMSWPGGRLDLEKVALDACETALVYGDANTISSYASRAPAKLIAYGPRMSAGLILRDCAKDLPQIAAKASLNVALFDQRGCLSPQFFLVEEPCLAAEFAHLLAEELRHLAEALPRSPLDLEGASRLRTFVEHCRWLSLSGGCRDLVSDEESLRWVVSVLEAPDLVPFFPANRAVAVVPVRDLEEAVSLLASRPDELEAVGVAGEMSRLQPHLPRLAASGVARVCRLERLQRPPFSWPQGGRRRLASLARWLEFEKAGLEVE